VRAGNDSFAELASGCPPASGRGRPLRRRGLLSMPRARDLERCQSQGWSWSEPSSSFWCCKAGEFDAPHAAAGTAPDLDARCRGHHPECACAVSCRRDAAPPDEVEVPDSDGAVVGSLPAEPAAPAPAPEHTGWRRPLPADFLSVPVVAAATSTPSDQMARDEAFARMMQDERFVEELSADPEVAAHMRRVQLAERARRDAAGRPGAAAPASASSGAGGKAGGAGAGGWFSSMGNALRARVMRMAGRGGGSAVSHADKETPSARGAPARPHERAGLLEERSGPDGETEVDLDVLGGDTPPPRRDGSSDRGGGKHGGFEPLV